MRVFFLNLIRLLTGRIAYEREASMLALQLAADACGTDVYSTLRAASLLQHFLLTGESPIDG